MVPEKNDKESYPFKLHQSDLGTFGVFQDYPQADEVLKKLEENADLFRLPNELAFERGRGVHIADFDIEGKLYYIKGKILNRPVSERTLDYPHSLDEYEKDNKTRRLNFSALNELLVNRKIKDRYQKTFNKELLIETPVGFFISKRPEDQSARWTVFEDIPNQINSIPSGKAPFLRMKKENFQEQIHQELKQIGVTINGTGYFDEYDLLPVGNIDNPRFALLDSEAWQLDDNSEELRDISTDSSTE